MTVEENLRRLLAWNERNHSGNSTKIKILIALANNPGVQIRMLAEIVGRAVSTTCYQLQELEKLGLVYDNDGRRQVSNRVANIVAGRLFGDAVNEPHIEPMEAIL